MNASPLRSAALVLALAVTTAFTFLGGRGLVGTSEGRYAACAQEMLARGDFIHPTLNGLPHWTKPPLTYWAIAAGVSLFGYNEWGVRTLNALAFVITALLVFLLGRRLDGPRTGLLAGAIYATAPATVLAAWVTTTDTFLCLWMTLAVHCWVAATQAPARGRMTGWLAVCGAALGLGFLAKGPVVLLALFAVFAWPLRPMKRALPGLGVALLAFAVAGLSWYVWVCREHPGLLGYFLGEEVVNRLSASADVPGIRIMIHNDEWYKVFTVYGPVLVAGLGLWMVPVARSLWRLRHGVWQALRRQAVLRFLAVWIMGPMAVLSISTSKLQLYMLPVFAPLAISAALLLVRAKTAVGWRPSHLRGCLLSSLLLLVGGKAVASYLPLAHDMRRLYRACQTQAPGCRVAIYGERRFYGLQFYLRGHLDRVGDRPRPAWADTTLADWLERIKGEPGGGVMLIIPENANPKVTRALEARRTTEVVSVPLGHEQLVKLYILRPPEQDEHAGAIHAE